MNALRDSRTGAASAATGLSGGTAPARSSEVSTASQKWPGSSSAGSSVIQAVTYGARCTSAATSAVLPLPAGAQTSVTGSSTVNRRRDRSTIPNGAGGMANWVTSAGVRRGADVNRRPPDPSDLPPDGMPAQTLLAGVDVLASLAIGE